MSRFGWGAIYVANAIVAAPAIAAAALLAGGYLAADLVREIFDRPTWEVDHSAVERLDHQLAVLADRYPAPKALDHRLRRETVGKGQIRSGR